LLNGAPAELAEIARAMAVSGHKPQLLGRFGRALKAARRFAGVWGQAHDEDGLISLHNHDFNADPDFAAAYARGIAAARQDYNWRWRIHTALWAAQSALQVSGDFIEFGVNRGFMASAIMQRLDWSTTDRTFFLLDTFGGLDEAQLTELEQGSGAPERNRAALESGFYADSAASVRANFAEWTGVQIIEGRVPDTLSQLPDTRFAFVSIDMNCVAPEIAAIEWVWSRLSPGALILLDDYGYLGHAAQKAAMDQFAAAKGVQILSLPTGQGLILSPR
jgi:Macrocin-O-methyltransferase (TylF)